MKRVAMAGLLALGVLFSAGAAFGESFSTVTVNADALNVRESDNIGSKLLGQARHGQALVVVGDIGEWYAIRTGENTVGYVNKEYCDWVSMYAEGAVLENDINMRETPSTEGKIITQLQPNQVLQVTSLNNGWYKATVGDKTGFVRMDKLKLGAVPQKSGAVSRGTERTDIVAFAKQQLGKPYSWGKTGPNSFDCSGFVTYVYKNVYNKTLPRSSIDMSVYGQAVDKADMVAGDLVFFATGGSSRVNHVGIYIGGGEFIHASSARSDYVVTINSLSAGYYTTVYRSSRRVPID